MTDRVLNHLVLAKCSVFDGYTYMLYVEHSFPTPECKGSSRGQVADIARTTTRSVTLVLSFTAVLYYYILAVDRTFQARDKKLDSRAANPVGNCLTTPIIMRFNRSPQL